MLTITIVLINLSNVWNFCSLFCCQRTRARLKISESEMKELKWVHEVLEQRFTKVMGGTASDLYNTLN